MPKVAKEMSAKALRDLSEPGTYAAGGVPGLCVVVTPKQGKCWILRTVVGTRRQELGLGGFPEVSLADARDRAREIKALIRSGVDVKAERLRAKDALKRSQSTSITFADAAKRCHAVKAQEFRNPKHAAQWYSTLETYAFPIIGGVPIADIDTPEVLAVLKPIWSEIPETAGRVRQRMAAVFDWSRAAKIRTQPNPAAWKDCLEPLLPNTQKVKRNTGKSVEHHPALPVQEVPRFMADIATRKATGAMALRFAILTATRSKEARCATWSEIDLKAGVWHLGSDRMKAGKAHTVPLSAAAVAILEAMPKDDPAGLVFASKNGGIMSENTLNKLIKDAHSADIKAGGQGYLDPDLDRIATQHGTARSSFKQWSLEHGRFPDEWSEIALAHVNNDQTRAAYARGALLEERRGMMEAWGQYCESPRSGGHVVAITAKPRRA